MRTERPVGESRNVSVFEYYSARVDLRLRTYANERSPVIPSFIKPTHRT